MLNNEWTDIGINCGLINWKHMQIANEIHDSILMLRNFIRILLSIIRCRLDIRFTLLMEIKEISLVTAFL